MMATAANIGPWLVTGTTVDECLLTVAWPYCARAESKMQGREHENQPLVLSQFQASHVKSVRGNRNNRRYELLLLSGGFARL